MRVPALLLLEKWNRFININITARANVSAMLFKIIHQLLTNDIVPCYNKTKYILTFIQVKYIFQQ